MSVIDDVLAERQRQENKWGQQNHAPIKWYAILGEEVGEIARGILESDYDNYREELIQTAAVAVAAAESFDRNRQ